MSGTSLDGIDIAYIKFHYDQKWTFKLGECETIPYSEKWVGRLRNAHTYTDKALEVLNEKYTTYLAQVIRNFIEKHQLDQSEKKIDLVCSHGHTIKHEPQNQYTLQIGNLASLATLIQKTVICDFRVQDVKLGGQGAPLVPIGDQILFADYDFCVNLGGFANFSFLKNNKRLAFDNCAVNTVLNYYANQLELTYDAEGKKAREGKLHQPLLQQLNELAYYQKTHPKSLGIEWVMTECIPLIENFTISIPDKLHTYVHHVAEILANDIKKYRKQTSPKILITGGGAYHGFLIDTLEKKECGEIVIPNSKLIEYKEALIFGLLGVLKWEGEINVLSSVTGSIKNHSSGKVYNYQIHN